MPVETLSAALASLSLELVHADDALLVVNKPSGLLAVPGRDPACRDSVASRVQSVVPEALIVHRLDMETSGLMLLARGKMVHRAMSIAFQDRQVEKTYIAVVAGCLKVECGEVDLPLMADWPNRPRQKIDATRGKPSLTRFRVLERGEDATRVELRPVTGRSHQLRLHMWALGHPILGDGLYAPLDVQNRVSRLLLHASALKFSHPVDGQRRSICSKPLF